MDEKSEKNEKNIEIIIASHYFENADSLPHIPRENEDDADEEEYVKLEVRQICYTGQVGKFLPHQLVHFEKGFQSAFYGIITIDPQTALSHIVETELESLKKIVPGYAFDLPHSEKEAKRVFFINGVKCELVRYLKECFGNPVFIE